jgi:hypothetical protein
MRKNDALEADIGRAMAVVGQISKTCLAPFEKIF